MTKSVKYSIIACTFPIAVWLVQGAACGAEPARPSSATDDHYFERFRHQETPWKVLSDPRVKKNIKAVMGNKDTKFWDCTQLTEQPKIVGTHYATSSGVRGLFTISESIFDLNLSNGKCCVGYLDDKDLHIFGARSLKEVPGLVKEYIDDLKKRREGDLTVHFEKPDWTPIVSSPHRSSPPAKKLNLSIATGTYERENATQFTRATLEVLTLPDGQLKFDVTAADGANVGEAQGVATLRDNRLVYRQGDGEIELQFNGATVTISGKDSYFCGLGATLQGCYRKVNDQPPKFDF
jgi:hypothetical protein